MSHESSSPSNELRRLNPEEIERLAGDLTPEERQVILHQGTEHPFCGNLLDNKREGQYACRLCGLPLFSSDDKFDSGTGWPSFTGPVHEDHVAELPDDSLGGRRVEIRCARCDAHLGHVFPDGPPPAGNRYCLNSVSMTFVDKGQSPPDRLAQL